MASAKAARPVAAAAIVLVDDTGAVPRFLMGRRADDLTFMPGYHVFPGGRVEAGDSALILGAPPLADDDAGNLAKCLGGRTTPERAQTIAAAGLRELAEEADFRPVAGARTPIAPLCRAITPAGMPRRFDTCFFIAFRRDFSVAGCAPDGEISNIAWHSVDDFDTLRVHPVTRFVSKRALAYLEASSAERSQFALHTRRHRNGQPVVDMQGEPADARPA